MNKTPIIYTTSVFILMAAVYVGVYIYKNSEPIGNDLTIAQDVTDLKTIIESDLQEDGTYKRRDKEIINGIEYEVHEYETSKGEIGYIINMTKEDDDGIYRKTETTGVYAEVTDWITISDKTTATTTTSTEK